MCQETKYTDIGLTNEKVAIGTHICLVYTSEEERTDCLLKFILSGMIENERTTCFSDSLTEEEVTDFLLKNNISYSEKKGEQTLSVNSADKIYFKDGVFNADRMLDTLTNYYKESKEMGYPSSRVIGEMSPKIEECDGGERLLEYESRVSLLLRENPITTICQYNANLFDGNTIMGVLKVHPQMIINGAIVKNPFFIEPEVFLNQN